MKPKPNVLADIANTSVAALTKKRSRTDRPAKARFPFYIARPRIGRGFCGHQHGRLSSAMNCAEAQAHGDHAQWRVFEVNSEGNEKEVTL
jgi:hypothetical protein